METHITNIYGLTGAGAEAQQATAAIAKKDLMFNELGIYHYPVEADTPEMLRTRVDGIIGSVEPGDIVIVQFPTWNGISFDQQLMNSLYGYERKRMILMHDILPGMSELWNWDWKRYLDLYNQADAIIVPSQNMADFLREKGLSLEKIIVRRMYDCAVWVDRSVQPPFRRAMNLMGTPDWDPRLQFCRQWGEAGIQLVVAAQEGDWAEQRNVRFLGQLQGEPLLLDAFRHSGGFGLLWTEEPRWREWVKRNASYELSAYLAAGLPVIVPSGIGEQETIVRKKLGIVVDSLEEAAQRIENMDEAEYREMADNVAAFSYLLQEGYFTKKALTDAVFQVLNG